MGNMTKLKRFGASMNKVNLLNLKSRNLFKNMLGGPLPESITSPKNLYELKHFKNKLNGTLPLQYVDNRFSGKIRESLCGKRMLENLILMDNWFIGKCRSLTRVRSSNNNKLSGHILEEFWGLPRLSLLQLSENSSTISGGKKNLSNLSRISNNRFLGGSIISLVQSRRRRTFKSMAWFWILLLSLLASSTRSEAMKEEDFVLTLDHSNFTETINKHDFIVVHFYAPWSHLCQKLAPEYEKAASELSTLSPPLALAKIDASQDANIGIAREYQILSFPILKILRNGGKSIQDYNGPYDDAEGIIAYLKKQSGPASVEIKSADVASEVVAENNVVAVGVFPKLSGEEFDSFMALADKLRADYDFGHTVDAKLLPRGGDSSAEGPLVRLFKPFDEFFVDSKDFNGEALEKFVTESSIPLVTVFDRNPANLPYVFKFFENPATTKVMMFLNFAGPTTETKTKAAKFREVAKSNKGQGLAFLIGDAENDQGFFEFFGLEESQVPLIIIETPDRKKYLITNIEADQIESSINDFKDGKIAAHVKSRPIPAENNEPVKVVVAESLDDIVFKSGKNVLIEFYIPWCGPCQKLDPILDEVALSFKNDPSVIIAKLDADANDIPTDAFDVEEGFPAIYFRSASGTVVAYEGDRTKEDFINFIEKNKSTSTHGDESTKTDRGT